MASETSLVRGRIVIVDDDQQMRELLEEFLKSEGYQVRTFSTAADALLALGPGGELAGDLPAGQTDAVISDIKMPKMDGLEFAGLLRNLRPEIPVILMTAFGSIETAIEAMKRGAFHYVVKPFKLAEMSVTVSRAVEHSSLKKENTLLKDEIRRTWGLGKVVGKSAAMKSVFDLVQRVSHAMANVLITGESGTGKEMVARAIHESGPRKNKPFVAINCSAIPETLLESELFGHAKGSFTGAINRKRGLFEEANGGTLFLDEIGDMDPSLQSKILRVIQEKKVRSVGDNIDREVDVRIIAATHQDLKAAIREHHFREDLFYRLSVIPITIPPLRHRREDIPILAEHFLRKYSAANSAGVRGFTKGAMNRLMSMRWEGNVRELENVVERSVILAKGELIDESDIPTFDAINPDQFFNSATGDFPTIQELEKRYIQLVLEKTSGRKDRAANILGINRRTLYRKEREYGFVADSSDTESLASSDKGVFEESAAYQH